MWAILISSAYAVVGVGLDQWGMPLIFDGQVVECPANQGDGRYLRMSNGDKIKGYCKNGLAVGKRTATSKTGFNWKGKLEGGKFVGTFKSWHTNGARWAKGKFEDGQKVGVWKYWHDNGSLSARGTWIANKESGCWEGYYGTGERSWAGAYVDGEKVGRWLSWTDAGKDKQLYGGEPTQGACWWILW